MKKVFPLVFLCAAAMFAADSPKISYSKAFKGSKPEFQAVVLERSGEGEYKEAADDDSPVKFKLAEAQVKEIFELADQLDRFKKPLESGLKVAFMGTKTFQYENGAEKAEVKFNYSEDLAAQKLADWFEKICESAQHRVAVETAARFDKLGVMKAILLLEASYDRKRLVALDQFLPMLDRIAKNETYMHTARLRAAALADHLRAELEPRESK